MIISFVITSCQLTCFHSLYEHEFARILIWRAFDLVKLDLFAEEVLQHNFAHQGRWTPFTTRPAEK